MLKPSTYRKDKPVDRKTANDATNFAAAIKQNILKPAVKRVMKGDAPELKSSQSEVISFDSVLKGSDTGMPVMGAQRTRQRGPLKR